MWKIYHRVKTYKYIVGKRIIVCLSCLEENEYSQIQFQIYGRVVKADEHSIIVYMENNDDVLKSIASNFQIDLVNKEFVLPPLLSGISYAVEGEYHLKYSNEIVHKPDFVSSWTIKPIAKNSV